jgi:hypothetical protein
VVRGLTHALSRAELVIGSARIGPAGSLIIRRVGSSFAKVSWRVEAVRNDRWVQKNGAPVESEKEGREKGTYQYPELYGQPKEKGMNYDAARERKERTDAARPEPVQSLPVPNPSPKQNEF